MIRGLGGRVPVRSLGLLGLALLMLPGAVLGAAWTPAKRVSSDGGSRLDSMHQLAGSNGAFHLVHPRLERGSKRDKVVYQRSPDGGKTWGRERTVFSGTSELPNVVPNLAIDAGGSTVALTWRSTGRGGTVLYTAASRNGGFSFGPRVRVASSKAGIGVPAIAVGDGVIAVAWTERKSGVVKVRVSRDGGESFKKAKRLGRTFLSIDCKKRTPDGLVGAAAFGRRIHVAWSHSAKRACQATSIHMVSSANRGASWDRRRTVSKRRSYGWPELDARGRTVVATVQLPSGDLLVARSGKNGREWTSRTIKARKGHLLSAGDIALLPKGKAVLTYVDERVRKNRLVSTTVVSRRSSSDARRFGSVKRVMGTARQLRLAPNVASSDRDVVVAFQSGAFDGSPRNVFAARLR